MSRRAPSGPPATEPGVVYTLHFDPPYPPHAQEGAQVARHYTGWARDLAARLADHAAGRGARLTQVQLAAGGTWRLASAEPGTRDLEARRKERGATRRCKICRGQPEVDLDIPPEPGARWIANEPDRVRRPDSCITPEVAGLVDRLIAGWAACREPEPDLEAGL